MKGKKGGQEGTGWGVLGRGWTGRGGGRAGAGRVLRVLSADEFFPGENITNGGVCKVSSRRRMSQGARGEAYIFIILGRLI